MASNQTINIIKSGDLVSKTICFTYDGGLKQDNAALQIGGLDTVGITVQEVLTNQGVASVTTGEWLVAALIPKKEYCATIVFTIEDTCLLKDGIEFTLSDDCGCGVDACCLFEGVGCCFIRECLSDFCVKEYETVRIVEEWDGSITTWTSPIPDGEIELSSVTFNANGPDQFYDLTSYGFTITGGGLDTPVEITPTETWGEPNDPCKIQIIYTVIKEVCPFV